MRVRAVNEKAVAKLIAYLTELKKDLNDGIYVTGTHLQTKHQVSKSTYSVCKKLGIITEDQKWNQSFVSDRKTAIKILEYLRQQSDKQSDKPISDLWVQEITHIKGLLTEIRDNAKKKDNRSEGFKISERVYLVGQIANGIYSNAHNYNINIISFQDINNLVIEASKDLLSKLNS